MANEITLLNYFIFDNEKNKTATITSRVVCSVNTKTREINDLEITNKEPTRIIRNDDSLMVLLDIESIEDNHVIATVYGTFNEHEIGKIDRLNGWELGSKKILSKYQATTF